MNTSLPSIARATLGAKDTQAALSPCSALDHPTLTPARPAPVPEGSHGCSLGTTLLPH